MRIKIKNLKSLNEIDKKRRERINDEVIRFLADNGYVANRFAKDPLTDLVNRVHKDGKKVMVKTKNEKLDKNSANGLLILTFELVIYFQSR